MNPYDKIMNDWMNKQYEESMKYYTKMVYSYFGIPKDFDGRTMLNFSHIKYKGGKSKRVYTAENKNEAMSFAHRFSGYYWEFVEGEYYVII